MDSFKESYKKGSVLMQNALKKYAEGDFKGGDIDREQANEFFDLAEKEMNVAITNSAMLYGENRNFGIIYHVFEENLPSLIKEKKTKVIKEIVKLIKEDKTLKLEFKTYQKLLSTNNVLNEEIFINDVIDTIPSDLTIENLNESNNKLIDLFKKYKINEMIDIDEKQLQLYESIQYLFTNKKTIDNVNDFSNAKTIIKEHITNIKNNFKQTDSKSYQKKLDEICDKYSDKLTDEEFSLLEKINGSEDKQKSIFEETKNNTIDIIKNELSECNSNDKERLLNILNLIEEKNYNKDKIYNDIIEMLEIQEVLS